MILPDVSILVLAFAEEADRHEAARDWLLSVLENNTRLAIADVVASGVVRVCTNRRVFTAPADTRQVTQYIGGMLESPNVVPLSAGGRHWPIFSGILNELRATGNLVTDAHIASLALEHGCRVATLDSDFAKFSGLDWFNPLSTSGR